MCSGGKNLSTNSYVSETCGNNLSISSATAEIARVGGLSSVQGHSRSLIVVPVVRVLGFNMITTTLSILGKSFACMAFAVVYVFGSELFPTEARNVVLGTAKTCSRFSSMAASYVGGPLVSYNPSPSRL